MSEQGKGPEGGGDPKEVGNQMMRLVAAFAVAAVLLLAGIAPRFDWQPLVVVILVAAVALLVIGLYNLITLPIQ